MTGTRADVSLSRARYRSVRLAVLGAGLLVGIGYPLVLALGGSVLVELHAGHHGTTIAVHNARPWLVIAAVAAVLILIELRTVSGRAGAAGALAGPASDAPAGPAPGAVTPGRLRREIEGIEAARRSEREWNAALDLRLVELSRPAPGDAAFRADIADAVLELTMELLDASAGLLAIGSAGRTCAVAARGVAEADEVAAALQPPPAPGVAERRSAPSGEWLVLGLGDDARAEARGILALGERTGGFGGLDDGVLDAVARRAGVLLMVDAAG